MLALSGVAACSDGGAPEAPATRGGTGRSALSGAYAGSSLLVISIDTLRADRLGVYGYERPTSPHLDAFAREAIVFEDAYASSPKTASSHMTLFTSLLPTVHGVQNIRPEEGGLMTVLAKNRRTLAEVLLREGYWNMAIANGGNLQPQMGFARGFEGRWTTLVDDVSRIVNIGLNMAAAVPPGRPGFLFVHTYQVHGPYVPPARFVEEFCPELRGTVGERVAPLVGRSYEELWRNERVGYWDGWEDFTDEDTACLSDLYDGEIAYTDQHLGRLFRGLAESGFLDRAIVVVLSDHGEEFAEHGRYDHNQLFTESLHVPLIVRLPDGRGAGTRVSGTVGLIDVMPTVLDLLGVASPRDTMGVSQAAAIERGSTDDRPVVAERVRWEGEYQASLRDRERNVVFDAARRALDGYDLVRDPAEQTPLGPDAGFHDAASAELHRRLVEAFALRDALDARGKGGRRRADADTLEQLEGLGYTGEGPTAEIVDGTPLERWPTPDE